MDKVTYDLISGELVLINSISSNADDLNAVCKKHNLPTPFTSLTAVAALKHTLQRNALHSDMVVRGTKRSNRFQVMQEQKGDVRNKYTPVMTYQIDLKTWTVSTVDVNGITTPDPAMTHQVAAWKGIILAGTVTSKLVSLLTGQFDATRMRRNGGAYFVPAIKRDAWGGFVTDLQTAGLKIQRIQTSMDADTATAIVENSVVDLKARYEQLFEELETVSIDDDMEDATKQRKMTKLEADLRAVQATAVSISNSLGGAAELEQHIVDEIEGRMALALL